MYVCLLRWNKVKPKVSTETHTTLRETDYGFQTPKETFVQSPCCLDSSTNYAARGLHVDEKVSEKQESSREATKNASTIQIGTRMSANYIALCT